MAGLAIAVCAAACGFSAPNSAANDGSSGARDAGEGDAPLLDGLVPVDSGIDAPPDAPPPPGCITNTVRASRTYLPSSSSNGVVMPQAPYQWLVVPAELPIEFGNAGNHCASVELTNANNELVRCRYRGGADIGTTFGNLVQSLKGLRYVFDGCTLGAACPSLNGVSVAITAGQRVEMASSSPVTVHIASGDGSQGPTIIRVGVERCDDSDDDDD